MSQRIYEYRSGFGSTAIALVQAFFESDKTGQYDTDEQRQEFAGDMLDDLQFLYADANRKVGCLLPKFISH